MIELRARGGKLVLLAMGLGIGGFATSLDAKLPTLAYEVGFPLVLAFGLFAWRHHRQRRLTLDDGGIAETSGTGRVRRLAWDDVRFYRYSSELDRPIVSAMAIGRPSRLRTGRLELIGNTGVRLSLNGDAWLDPARAFAFAFDRLHQRLRLRTRDYAPFTLSTMGLTHADAQLPLEDLERVEIQGGTVRVFTAGKRWASVRLASVRNPMLFVEELGSRGVDVALALNAPMPRIQHDAPIPDNPAPMPRARVVK